MMKNTIAVEEEQIATTAGKLFTAGEEPRPTAEEVRSYHERARDVHLLRRDTRRSTPTSRGSRRASPISAPRRSDGAARSKGR